MNCTFSKVAGKIKDVCFTYFALFFSAHVLFLSIQIGLRSLARCLCISAALNHTYTITNTSVTTTGTQSETQFPTEGLGSHRFHSGKLAVRRLLCPTPPHASLSIYFHKSMITTLKRNMKHIKEVDLSQQRQASKWWGMGHVLKFSDHSDISHSLRKTILKAGKQISLMNSLRQLRKHNNVSLETLHQHKESDSAQVAPNDQRENFNFDNPKGQKHY